MTPGGHAPAGSALMVVGWGGVGLLPLAAGSTHHLINRADRAQGRPPVIWLHGPGPSPAQEVETSRRTGRGHLRAARHRNIHSSITHSSSRVHSSW